MEAVSEASCARPGPGGAQSAMHSVSHWMIFRLGLFRSGLQHSPLCSRQHLNPICSASQLWGLAMPPKRNMRAQPADESSDSDQALVSRPCTLSASEITTFC